MSLPKIAMLEPSDAGRLLPLFDQVQRLHVAAHPALFRADASEAEKEAFLRGWLSQDAMHALIAMAEDGAILGYLIYERRERAASVVQNASRIGFLHHIAVDEAHRGKRLGTRLMDTMKERLRRDGIATLQSEHFAFNEASAALMRSAGLAPLRITVQGAI